MSPTAEELLDFEDVSVNEETGPDRFTVPEDKSGVRADVFVSESLGITRSAAQKLSYRKYPVIRALLYISHHIFQRHIVEFSHADMIYAYFK